MLTRPLEAHAQADPVLANFEFPFTTVIYPLGYPVRIETNSNAVIRAAHESWPDFDQAFDKPPIRLNIGVRQDSPKYRQTGAPIYRNREHVLSIISGPDDFMVVDLSAGFSFGWVTPSTVGDSGFFRFYFLEAAALASINHLYLTPIHGALIAMAGRGILLCGESLAGKSTLAYACARAGWTFMSDDGTFLQRDRSDRYAVGNPYSMRFREDARHLFPELGSRLTSIRPNGKLGIEVSTTQLPNVMTGAGCMIEHVVFLNRHAGGKARLRAGSPREALEELSQTASWGTQQVRNQWIKDYQRILSGGVWHMDYGDLESAIARLTQLVMEGA